MVLPPDLPLTQIERCRRITFGRESAFVALGRTLDPSRRDLFAVTYASMRLPDDFVDEVYLKSTAQGIPVPAEFVAAWIDRYFAAVLGDFEGDLHLTRHPVVRAARAVLPCLGLGDRPWRALARCLHRDIAGRPPEDWVEFEEYCEGACVAPAVVFLSILEHDRPGLLPRGFTPVARDVRSLAVYCYLVHLARDLDRDLAIHRQLSCVPLSLLPDPGPGRATSPTQRARARARLLERASELEEEVLARLESYRAKGPRPATAALDLTLQTYRQIAQGLLAEGEGRQG